MTSQQRQKEKIKARIKASNEMEAKGFDPDPWVVAYRDKNNKAKAKWKARQPKSDYVAKANSGSFKKGIIPKNKLSPEEKLKSIERTKEYQRQWRFKNRDRINQQRRDKRKTNPSFRIAGNLRKRLSFLIRKHSTTKSKQTLLLLGCTMPEFLKYLESKFADGMSWENYGKWHVDHIIPCNSFDLTEISNQEQCFHYTNLQPLWAMDNIIKSDRI